MLEILKVIQSKSLWRICSIMGWKLSEENIFWRFVLRICRIKFIANHRTVLVRWMTEHILLSCFDCIILPKSASLLILAQKPEKLESKTYLFQRRARRLQWHVVLGLWIGAGLAQRNGAFKVKLQSQSPHEKSAGRASCRRLHPRTKRQFRFRSVFLVTVKTA